MTDKFRGIIKWYNVDKGFGFIIPDKGGKDVFLHCTNLTDRSIKRLEEGQIVEYEEFNSRKGVEGRNVTVILGEGNEVS